MKEYIEKLESSGDYRVIARFKPVSEYHKNVASNDLMMGIYLDVETTGRNHEFDKIIELSLVPFEYDLTGKIYQVFEPYNSFQEPGKHIPELITTLTGIDDEMVKGHKIDLDEVSKFLDSASIVISHNANFDRPFVEKLTSKFAKLNWGCSLNDVNWAEEGLDGMKLSYIAYRYGFFYEAHRATVDCQVGIEILTKTLFNSGELVLKRLLENSGRTEIRLYAKGSPFDKKDILKSRGYRWSPGSNVKIKAWYYDLDEKDLEKELQFLTDHVYPIKVQELPMDKITAKERYSSRV